MANRRMISKDIFFSDRFTDMSVTARMLYVYMILNADDEGMLSNLKQVIFMAGGNKEDIQELIDNGYVKKFESGVYAIIHWYLMNRVQPTRRKNTIFSAELEELGKDEVYESCRQYVDKVPTQSSTGQSSTGQDSTGQGSTGQENLGQGSTGDDDDASSPHQNELDNALLKVTDEIRNNPALKELIELFKSNIAPIRKPADAIALCDLYKKYGKQPLLMAMAKTKQKGGKSVEYLREVIESQNE